MDLSNVNNVAVRTALQDLEAQIATIYKYARAHTDDDQATALKRENAAIKARLTKLEKKAR